MNTLLAEILDTRSMTVIVYKVEGALETATTDEDVKLLRSLLNAISLDEVWAICHEQRGEISQAKELRDWIARRHQL